MELVTISAKALASGSFIDLTCEGRESGFVLKVYYGSCCCGVLSL